MYPHGSTHPASLKSKTEATSLVCKPRRVGESSPFPAGPVIKRGWEMLGKSSKYRWGISTVDDNKRVPWGNMTRVEMENAGVYHWSNGFYHWMVNFARAQALFFCVSCRSSLQLILWITQSGLKLSQVQICFSLTNAEANGISTEWTSCLLFSTGCRSCCLKGLYHHYITITSIPKITIVYQIHPDTSNCHQFTHLIHWFPHGSWAAALARPMAASGNSMAGLPINRYRCWYNLIHRL